MVRPFLILVLSYAVPALAAPPRDAEVLAQAKAHFEAGRAAYEAREFEKAIVEFEQAQQLAPSPMLDHNIGLAHEQLGHAPEAVAHYRSYLKAKPDAANHAEVEKRIASLEPAIKQEGVECPPGQTSNEDTAGHCCWPGQVWSKRRSTCAGIPQCPQGLVARGEYCTMPMPAQPMPLDTSNPWPAYPGWQQPRPMAPPGTVPATFNPKRTGYTYVVSIGKIGCTAPCTLYLKPGRYTVHVSGDGEFDSPIVVAGPATVVRVEHMRLHKLIGGGIVTLAGLIALGAGIFMATETYEDIYGTRYTGSNVGWGYLLGLSGIVLVAIGVPTMAVTDGNRAKVLETNLAELPKPQGIRLVGAGVAPTPGGAMGSIGFSF